MLDASTPCPDEDVLVGIAPLSLLCFLVGIRWAVWTVLRDVLEDASDDHSSADDVRRFAMNFHLNRQVEEFRKRNARSAALLGQIREEKEAKGSRKKADVKPGANLTKVKKENTKEEKKTAKNDARRMRAVPIGRLIKMVLDVLFKVRNRAIEKNAKEKTGERHDVLTIRKRCTDLRNRQKQTTMTVQDVSEAIQYDVEGDAELKEALKSNPKVSYDDIAESLCYQAKYNARDKDELYYNVILKSVDGVSCDELKDVYHGIDKDIQELKKEGKCFVLTNTQTKLSYVYPSDKHTPSMKVDEALKELWREIDVPEDPEDLDMALQRIGQKPSPRPPAYRRPQKTKGEKKRKAPSWNNRQVTNSHLKGTEIFAPLT